MRIVSALVALLMLSACGDGDTVTVYKVQKVNPADSKGHEWLPLNPTTYRVGETIVVSETIGILSKYTDCAILSVDDWECAYSDGSGSMGIQNGEYWRQPEREGFRVVSRLEYHLIECEWDFGYDMVWGSFACVSRWF